MPASKPYIDEALTRRVAELARLKLSSEETSLFTRQLSEILGYIELLQSVDVQGVEPLSHPVALETPLRQDDARTFESSALLEAAPETLHGGYKVPQII